MSILKNYRIYSLLLIVALAVLTGLSVGKLYLDTNQTAAVVSADESSIRDSEASIVALANQASSGKSALSFSAVELYNIAEYQLYNSDAYYKEMTGKVYATAGVTQNMLSQKLKLDDVFIANKLSPSTSALAPAIASQTVYDINTGNIKLSTNGKFPSNMPIIPDFSESTYEDYTLAEYEEVFSTQPTKSNPFIISSKIITQEMYSAVTDNSNGTFSFSFDLSGDSLAFAALYYSQEIKFSSAMGLPRWVSLEMEVTIDSNFNFVSVSYNEEYQMNAPVIGNTTVKNVFTDKFYFDNLPSISDMNVKEGVI